MMVKKKTWGEIMDKTEKAIEDAYDVREYFRDLAVNFAEPRAIELLEKMDNIIDELEIYVR